MKKTNLSMAEQSQLTTKEAEDRKNAEKNKKKKELTKFTRELDKKRALDKAQNKRDAIPIGEKLYSYFCEEITKAAKNAKGKVMSDFGNSLCGIGMRHGIDTRTVFKDVWSFIRHNEELINYAYDYAADKLRLDGYQVRFGKDWSETYVVNPYESHDTETIHDTKWAKSAFGSFFVSMEAKESDVINIEISWVNEEKNKS